MPPESAIADFAHVIQLSVAPVFLLTAVGTILGVQSTRLGRIVDRSRVLLERLVVTSADQAAPLKEELHLLLRRRRVINVAITCSTCAALCVAALIGALFLGFLMEWHVAWAVATIFLLAMVFFVGSLLFFLREVLMAAASVHLERH